jgi:hypothetical protein
MPDLASKPVRRVEARDTSFERLLDSDEAAALLKILPKLSKKWPETETSPLCRSEDCGAFAPQF